MDHNTAANAAIAASIARDSRPAVTCRDCGTRRVAWVTSKRTGRNYLADATASNTPGRVLPAAHLPHFKTCNGSREGLEIGGPVSVRGHTGIFKGVEETALGERLLVRYDHDGSLVPTLPFEVKKL